MNFRTLAFELGPATVGDISAAARRTRRRQEAVAVGEYMNHAPMCKVTWDG